MTLQATPEPSRPLRREVGVSVVVPVFNEEASLRELHHRLRGVLDGLTESSEVIYVDDGSTDESRAVLEELGAADPALIVVELAHNAGQHGAVLAGFQVSRGKVVVTIDADLQNPPEEIPKLLAKVAEGFDVVGGVRQRRKDSWGRLAASRMVREFSARGGPAAMDYGCMLRAYRREIVQRVLRWREHSLFIPALAERFTKRVAEVPVAHEERQFGRSRYGVLRLMRLGFDFLTGFSVFPVQLVTLFGIFTALAGLSFAIFLFIRRLFVGPESEGVFTLFAILFLFVGALFVAIGVVGEYVARIYNEVRRRPLYVIESIHRRSE
ncbi:MAG TPA: glycosyltransferase [Candidatus Binatia bacterium]|nr:glycosyltransferase [Candidatus Binatia bacterium]